MLNVDNKILLGGEKFTSKNNRRSATRPGTHPGRVAARMNQKTGPKRCLCSDGDVGNILGQMHHVTCDRGASRIATQPLWATTLGNGTGFSVRGVLQVVTTGLVSAMDAAAELLFN